MTMPSYFSTLITKQHSETIMKVDGMAVGLREMKYAAKLALSPFIIVSDCCVFTKVEK
jgi:hypothetical protein